jgi:hypothetical protein
MDIGNLGPGLYEASWIGLVFNPHSECFQLTFILFAKPESSNKTDKVTRTLCLNEKYEEWVTDFAIAAGLCYSKSQPRQCLPGSIDIDCDVSLKALPGCTKRACIHQVHLEDVTFEVPTSTGGVPKISEN